MLKKANISDEYPEPFRKAISYVRNKSGYDYSITELMKPLQAVYLSYKHDYEIDALKNTAALLGTSFHHFMEIQGFDNPEDWIMEERFFKVICEMTISGQMDLYHRSTKTLWDYKTTGMYKAAKAVHSKDLMKDCKEWVIQTNSYRYLSGLPCDHIKILAIIKDFKYNNTYGLTKPAVVIELPKVKSASIEKWLEKRVDKIKKVVQTGEYPRCSEEDTWGGVRCKDWCDVNHLCPQFIKG